VRVRRCEMVRVNTNKNDKIYAVTRKKETNRVLAVFNLSSEYQDFIIHDVDDFEGERCYFTQDVFKSMRMSLHPWGYKVFVSNK
jgi:hypothetical protein